VPNHSTPHLNPPPQGARTPMGCARRWLARAPRNETASSRAQQIMGQEQLFVGPRRASRRDKPEAGSDGASPWGDEKLRRGQTMCPSDLLRVQPPRRLRGLLTISHSLRKNLAPSPLGEGASCANQNAVARTRGLATNFASFSPARRRPPESREGIECRSISLVELVVVRPDVFLEVAGDFLIRQRIGD
jgi:hypothetical protein